MPHSSVLNSTTDFLTAIFINMGKSVCAASYNTKSEMKIKASLFVIFLYSILSCDAANNAWDISGITCVALFTYFFF